jgi:hypothetical protein
MNLFKRLVIALEKIAEKKDAEFIIEDIKNVLIHNIKLQETMMERLKVKDLERRYFYLKQKEQETLLKDEIIEIQVWEKHYMKKVAPTVL